MSLQQEARKFLARHFPTREDLTKHWNRELTELPCRPMGIDNYNRVGSVFEIAVGLDLAEEPPFRDLLDCLADAERAELLTNLGYTAGSNPEAPWRRTSRCELPVDDAQQAVLDTVCRMYLADTSLGKDRLASPHERREYFRSFDDARWPLRGAERDALTKVWRDYLAYGRLPLLAFGRTVAVQPPLAEGAARADLIMGTTLVDIKVHYDPTGDLGSMLDQLLTYVLADTDDAYGLTGVAIYLGCQGGVLTLELDEVLSTAQRTGVSWAELRRWFYYDTKAAREKS